MPKKNARHPQYEFNRTDYGFDVYWFVYFTYVYYEPKHEKDYKTVIKAPSADKAKSLLRAKVKREHPKNSIKSLKTYKIHAYYACSGVRSKPLSPKEWEAIRAISFPNSLDKLHLIEKPRKPGQTNYFDRRITAKDLARLKKVGFQKGEENWTTLNPITDADRPPPEERHLYRMKPGGRAGASWEKIPPEERLAQRIEIGNALTETKGNRAAAARLMGMHKKDLRRLMFEKHPEIDWNTEYPIGGRPPRSKEAILKQKATYQKNKHNRVNWWKGKKHKPETIAKRSRTTALTREKRLAKMKPKIIAALTNNNNIRARAARELGISRHCLWKAMKAITEVDWETEYPSPIHKRKTSDCRPS
tara:strand:+ start:940 stop:2019 length:1080 start_codon:yes stop_codon:yes gene_type:complete